MIGHLSPGLNGSRPPENGGHLRLLQRISVFEDKPHVLSLVFVQIKENASKWHDMKCEHKILKPQFSIYSNVT